MQVLACWLSLQGTAYTRVLACNPHILLVLLQVTGTSNNSPGDTPATTTLLGAVGQVWQHKTLHARASA